MQLPPLISSGYSGISFSDTGDKVVGANIAIFSYICSMKLRALSVLLAALLLGTSVAHAVTGPNGEQLTASKTSAVKSGELVTVSGKGFDKKVGIYVEMCQIVPAGILPDTCGGGVNASGTSAASFWISSNPPSYGRNLAIPYKPGGSFSVGLKVQHLIGKIDCLKVKCAIYVRSDHTRTQDRTHDIKIPITFSK